jgi:hypothetical protein
MTKGFANLRTLDLYGGFVKREAASLSMPAVHLDAMQLCCDSHRERNYYYRRLVCVQCHTYHVRQQGRQLLETRDISAYYLLGCLVLFVVINDKCA